MAWMQLILANFSPPFWVSGLSGSPWCELSHMTSLMNFLGMTLFSSQADWCSMAWMQGTMPDTCGQLSFGDSLHLPCAGL